MATITTSPNPPVATQDFSLTYKNPITYPSTTSYTAYPEGSYDLIRSGTTTEATLTVDNLLVSSYLGEFRYNAISSDGTKIYLI